MDFELTSQQRELTERAAWVASECLEPRAAQYDATGAHPVESWRDLWKHGFLGAAVPREYGGLGLDMLTYVMVIERLAQGCTNSTMTMHMHSVVQRFIEALAAPHQKSELYAEVIEEGRLFGSWGSEPESRGGTVARDTMIAPSGDGYIINGRKHFCTMAGAARRYMVHCTMQGYKGSAGYTLALVPDNAPGMKILGEWNTLGMRATVSPSVSFEECFVDADAVLGRPGEAHQHGVSQAFGLGYAAIYLGAAQKAVDYAVEYCKTHQFAPDPTPLSQSIVVQRHVAEMTMALEGARLVLYQSASRWEGADPVKRWELAARAKFLATEAALMVTAKALQTVGGRSAHKSMPLERLFRDVRTSTLMPPNADRSMEIIGKTSLGVQDEAIAARLATGP